MNSPETRISFGRYQLLSLLGEGGMARVYQAILAGPMGFEKTVALKRIDSRLTKDDRFVKALINEARLGGQLKHGNIVEVYEFNQVGEDFYLAMEYVNGWTMEVLIRAARQARVPIPPRVVLEITTGICHGLTHAHQAKGSDGKPLGLVHRDLKPGNIMISRTGEVKIMDFGIAKANSNLYKTTAADVTKGTPVYMSPEQVLGLEVSAQSDLFALGTLVYELLVGDVIFKGQNLLEVMHKVLQADIFEAVEAVDLALPGMGLLLGKLMAREADARFDTARGFAREFQELGRDLPPGPDLHDFIQELLPWLPPEVEPGDFGQWDNEPLHRSTESLPEFQKQHLRDNDTQSVSGVPAARSSDMSSLETGILRGSPPNSRGVVQEDEPTVQVPPTPSGFSRRPPFAGTESQTRGPGQSGANAPGFSRAPAGTFDELPPTPTHQEMAGRSYSELPPTPTYNDTPTRSYSEMPPFDGPTGNSAPTAVVPSLASSSHPRMPAFQASGSHATLPAATGTASYPRVPAVQDSGTYPAGPLPPKATGGPGNEQGMERLLTVAFGILFLALIGFGWKVISDDRNTGSPVLSIGEGLVVQETEEVPGSSDQAGLAEEAPAAGVEATEALPDLPAEPAEPIVAAEVPSELPASGRSRSSGIPAGTLEAPPTGRERQAEEPAENVEGLGTSYMLLDARPWANVFLDGRPLGTTPLVRVEIPAGTHNLRLDCGGCRERGRTWSRSFEVEEGAVWSPPGVTVVLEQ